jgi:hypothetical protein
MGHCHISATVLGITWTERWLGDGSVEMDQSLGILVRQIKPHCFLLWFYVKHIFYQFKINDLQHHKARIKDAVATVTPNMLQAMWNKVEYQLDICCATKGAHIEVY